MSPTDDLALSGTLLEGRYLVEKVIGVGGFGLVYRAKHIGLAKDVAIKVMWLQQALPESAVTEIHKLFVSEAQIVASLRSQHIVRAIDFGRSQMPNGAMAPWMALEWMDGPTLREWHDAHGRLPMEPGEVLALLRPVFLALIAAHEAQPHPIAHRDLKPANIMARDKSEPPEMVLMDFGIAKVMSAAEAGGARNDERTTAKLGGLISMWYGAPEQISGMTTGPWTDVHALALILVELLTGKRAYAERSKDSQQAQLEAIQAITSSKRPTPASRGHDVGAWEPVLARALHLHSKERYPDARAFLQALEAALPEAHSVTTPMVRDPIAPSNPADTGNATRAARRLVVVEENAPSIPSGDTTRAPVTSAVRASPSSRWTPAVGAALIVAMAAGGIALWTKRAQSTGTTAGAPPAAHLATPLPSSPPSIVMPAPIPATPIAMQAPPPALEARTGSASASPTAPGARGRHEPARGATRPSGAVAGAPGPLSAAPGTAAPTPAATPAGPPHEAVAPTPAPPTPAPATQRPASGQGGFMDFPVN